MLRSQILHSHRMYGKVERNTDVLTTDLTLFLHNAPLWNTHVNGKCSFTYVVSFVLLIIHVSSPMRLHLMIILGVQSSSFLLFAYFSLF